MKKFLLLSALMFIGAYFFVGCSNEENEGISVEAQLENIKQKCLHYAELYGVENLQFDDELLIKHLNMSDEQIENSIIHFAALMGVLKKDASSLRKKFRTRSVGNRESNPPHYKYLYIEGEFTDSAYVDTLYFSYSIRLLVQSNGFKAAMSPSAKVTRLYRCNNENCQILHKGETEDANMYKISLESLNIDWTGDNEGDIMITDIPYTSFVNLYKNVFSFNTFFSKTYYSFRTTIHEGIAYF